MKPPESKFKLKVPANHLARLRRWLDEGDVILVYRNCYEHSSEFGHQQVVRFNVKRHGAVPALKSQIRDGFCQVGVAWHYLLVAVVRSPSDLVSD